jgi:hypothetical protein
MAQQEPDAQRGPGVLEQPFQPAARLRLEHLGPDGSQQAPHVDVQCGGYLMVCVMRVDGDEDLPASGPRMADRQAVGGHHHFRDPQEALTLAFNALRQLHELGLLDMAVDAYEAEVQRPLGTTRALAQALFSAVPVMPLPEMGGD